MTAVPIVPVADAAAAAAAADELRWLAPAPLWTGPPIRGALRQPWIAELSLETFTDDLLAILGGTGGRSPADLAGTRPATTEGGALRLLAPTDPNGTPSAPRRRSYLVAATLVCHRPGIPDHTVATRGGERAVSVVRRLEAGGAESALVPGPGGTSWQPADAAALTPGELEQPLHPAPVAAFAAAGTVAAELGMAAGQRSTRTVRYGYVPVGRVAPDGGAGRTFVLRAVLVRGDGTAVVSAPTPPFEIEAPPQPLTQSKGPAS